MHPLMTPMFPSGEKLSVTAVSHGNHDEILLSAPFKLRLKVIIDISDIN